MCGSDQPAAAMCQELHEGEHVAGGSEVVHEAACPEASQLMPTDDQDKDAEIEHASSHVLLLFSAVVLQYFY